MSARQFVPEMEARRHLVEPYQPMSGLPAEVDAAWKAPYGPAESWDLEIADTAYPGPHGPVPARVYTPRGPAPAHGRPGLVWLHGGAFAWGGLDQVEAHEVARGIAGRADAVVVSVDYRLCPVPPALGGGGEDRVDERGEPVSFPVPHDDCFAAFEAVRAGAPELGIDAARLAIGGASAGGTLAAGVALHLADEGRRPWQLLLAYPVLHHPLPEPSEELAEALAVTPPVLLFPEQVREAIHRNYLGGREATRYAYPGMVDDLSVYPPAYVETSEFDTLRASGDAFAQQLAAAGVEVEAHVRAGVPHGHLDNVGLPAAAATMDALARRVAGRPA
jgi:xylan 1,4-beta-xylosidase